MQYGQYSMDNTVMKFFCCSAVRLLSPISKLQMNILHSNKNAPVTGLVRFTVLVLRRGGRHYYHVMRDIARIWLAVISYPSA